jgi:hypothetical protein
VIGGLDPILYVDPFKTNKNSLASFNNFEVSTTIKGVHRK